MNPWEFIGTEHVASNRQCASCIENTQVNVTLYRNSNKMSAKGGGSEAGKKLT